MLSIILLNNYSSHLRAGEVEIPIFPPPDASILEVVNAAFHVSEAHLAQLLVLLQV